MEASWLAAILVHPVGLLALLLVVGLSSYFLLRADSSGIGLRRLLAGYAGLVIVAFGIAAASSYVSPEEALRVWRVPADAYWQALANAFVTLSVLLVYAALIGAAVIGVPAIFLLARRGLGSVPFVLVASILISIAGGALLFFGKRPAVAS